ncbi:MAG: toxin-antitoxin system HicB family antitoxin [Calditrichaceae bacterium]|nr:toxin-antitoxin system HicB family antitoxin [Calditrichaceae bacterium]MBN2709318.1 toxin-antitoxin system HicB family antitoxin [Calditrichaceae bacterium]RQV94654.1 MAG: toxin-antitoxin system HicB family antitoxin [Calditrichota bacterium]
MSTLSIRVPDALKKKASRLARKNEMSFNAFVNHWLQIAVTREETLEWMDNRLKNKDTKELISDFGRFLSKTKQGKEPSAAELSRLLKE